VKAKLPELQRALADPGAIRLFLLYGPDEATSRALAGQLGAAMGQGAERIDLSGAQLREDPALLADEAAAISMFGGRRWILVEQAGDEILPAVEALLEAPAAGNPVAVVAGALRNTSALVKRVADAPNAMAFASYVPGERDAARLAVETGRVLGLTLRDDVARRVAETCGGNRDLIARELEKYALYLDAAPGDARALDHDVLDLLGADAGPGDSALGRLVDSALDGDATTLEEELARLHAVRVEGIALTRPLLRRLALLARLRADVEAGRSPAAVIEAAGKSLFWKDKAPVQRKIGRWRLDLIARSISRLIDAERAVMETVGPLAADAELLAICRQAARLRP